MHPPPKKNKPTCYSFPPPLHLPTLRWKQQVAPPVEVGLVLLYGGGDLGRRRMYKRPNKRRRIQLMYSPGKLADVLFYTPRHSSRSQHAQTTNNTNSGAVTTTH